jgi:hypothetical protein
MLPQQLSFDLGDEKEKGTYITTYWSDSVFVWHHCNYWKPVDHWWNCNIPIIRAGTVWDEALVMHIHGSVKHPPESQPMAYCHFLSSTAN